jgi:hypothetical protein
VVVGSVVVTEVADLVVADLEVEGSVVVELEKQG